jgi:hypothetical protein
MPDAGTIQRSLAGAWRLMTGKSDGLRLLDISVDGFWDSFFAIAVALPALLVGWMLAADQVAADPLVADSRLSLVLKLALIDLAVWIVPIAGFVAVAGPAGLGPRVTQLVVAYNWGEALFAWITLPVALVFLFVDLEQQLADGIMLIVFLGLAVLSWRLVTTALGRGPGTGSAVFGGMFVLSLVVLIALESMLDIYPSPPLAG